VLSTITWTLPRPPASKYPGGFPLYFEQNLIQLLGYPEKILHPFGGMAEFGERCDLRPEVNPDHLCDAHALPFEDDTYDLVILDPPYSDKEAADLYGTPPLKPGEFTKEAVRVCKPGGFVAVYTDREPRRPARTNHMVRVVVVLRPGHSPRICMVFQKRKPGMPHYGTEKGEEGYGA
jgi:SAM-dependent methyltransferase